MQYVTVAVLFSQCSAIRVDTFGEEHLPEYDLDDVVKRSQTASQRENEDRFFPKMLRDLVCGCSQSDYGQEEPDFRPRGSRTSTMGTYEDLAVLNEEIASYFADADQDDNLVPVNSNQIAAFVKMNKDRRASDLDIIFDKESEDMMSNLSVNDQSFINIAADPELFEIATKYPATFKNFPMLLKLINVFSFPKTSEVVDNFFDDLETQWNEYDFPLTKPWMKTYYENKLEIHLQKMDEYQRANGVVEFKTGEYCIPPALLTEWRSNYLDVKQDLEEQIWDFELELENLPEEPELPELSIEQLREVMNRRMRAMKNHHDF